MSLCLTCGHWYTADEFCRCGKDSFGRLRCWACGGFGRVAVPLSDKPQRSVLWEPNSTVKRSKTQRCSACAGSGRVGGLA
jgi:hypothetical protein